MRGGGQKEIPKLQGKKKKVGLVPARKRRDHQEDKNRQQTRNLEEGSGTKRPPGGELRETGGRDIGKPETGWGGKRGD